MMYVGKVNGQVCVCADQGKPAGGKIMSHYLSNVKA